MDEWCLRDAKNKFCALRNIRRLLSTSLAAVNNTIPLITRRPFFSIIKNQLADRACFMFFIVTDEIL